MAYKSNIHQKDSAGYDKMLSNNARENFKPANDGFSLLDVDDYFSYTDQDKCQQLVLFLSMLLIKQFFELIKFYIRISNSTSMHQHNFLDDHDKNIRSHINDSWWLPSNDFHRSNQQFTSKDNGFYQSDKCMNQQLVLILGLFKFKQ